MTLTTPAPARADEGHRYVIAIGYNGVPAGAEDALQPLRYADDDAIAFFSFTAPTAWRAHLLTIADVDTERRLGTMVPAARAPSLAELRAAVADVREALEEDAREHTPTTVYVYYSGHGSAAGAREPSLTLLDGALTGSVLYDEVLSRLPAGHVHLFVDACHAESVVRPRDAEARVVPTTGDDRAQFALATTLARFPNTGAVVAAAGAGRTHEWVEYLGGVFTHELLSGLRGAADVNGDGRIEYSELAAFLAAANGAVRDPRVRLEAVVHAPSADPRAPIVDLQLRTSDALLEVSGGSWGAIFVEDDRGDRLADARPERGQALRLALPADRTWFVHTGRGEAEVHPSPGARVALEALPFLAAPTGARGSLEAALYDGLFTEWLPSRVATRSTTEPSRLLSMTTSKPSRTTPRLERIMKRAIPIEMMVSTSGWPVTLTRKREASTPTLTQTSVL
jgi:hypothetical protein